MEQNEDFSDSDTEELDTSGDYLPGEIVSDTCSEHVEDSPLDRVQRHYEYRQLTPEEFKAGEIQITQCECDERYQLDLFPEDEIQKQLARIQPAKTLNVGSPTHVCEQGEVDFCDGCFSSSAEQLAELFSEI